MQVQAAVMPAAALSYPLQRQLAFDFPAYFREHRQHKGQPLATYAPATFVVSDPIQISQIDLFEVLQKRNRPMVIWELQSELSPQNTEAELFVAQTLKARGEQGQPAA